MTDLERALDAAADALRRVGRPTNDATAAACYADVARAHEAARVPVQSQALSNDAPADPVIAALPRPARGTRYIRLDVERKL